MNVFEKFRPETFVCVTCEINEFYTVLNRDIRKKSVFPHFRRKRYTHDKFRHAKNELIPPNHMFFAYTQSFRIMAHLQLIWCVYKFDKYEFDSADWWVHCVETVWNPKSRYCWKQCYYFSCFCTVWY